MVLAPAWSSMDTYDAHNATNIGLQAESDAIQGPQIDQLLAYVQAHPKGRVYAGAPTNWGEDFLVGAVPVFKYLESKDIDEVGYTLRTASLMTDPEYYFDESNPGDYPLFGIGYIITPGRHDASGARRQGRLLGGLLPVGAARRRLHPRLRHDRRADGHPGRRRDPERDTAGLPAPRGAARPHGGLQRAGGRDPDATDASTLQGTPGRVVAEHADLPNGTASAVVHTTRRATVVLSASYDPGWHATVNGRPAPTVMVAPALVGVVVGPGVHTVTFSYGGYGSYPALFVLALARAGGAGPGPVRVAPAAAVDGRPRRGDNGGP